MKARSSVATVLLIFLGLGFLVAIIGGGCAVKGYNRAIRLDESVASGWAQVENILQSRFDLIPNLMETVKGYAEHETEVMKMVTDSRAKYMQAGTRGGKVEAAAGFGRALVSLVALQENYPDLKAQASFQSFMVALEGTERRLAVERMRYNDAVKQLNAYRRAMFGRMFSSWAGVEEAEYFKAAEAAADAPKVDFGPP